MQKVTGTSEAEHPWQPRRHRSAHGDFALRIAAPPVLLSGKGEAKETLLSPHDKKGSTQVLPVPCRITESEWRWQRRH